MLKKISFKKKYNDLNTKGGVIQHISRLIIGKIIFKNINWRIGELVSDPIDPVAITCV
jgi:hypothetical protein